jgi:excisionase family DNA binding protein
MNQPNAEGQPEGVTESRTDDQGNSDMTLPVDADEVLTADEVAQMLKIPKSRIYQAARDHEIPSTPSLGRYVRFRRADVEAFIRGDRPS